MLKLIQEIIYNVTGKSNITDDTDFVKDQMCIRDRGRGTL